MKITNEDVQNEIDAEIAALESGEDNGEEPVGTKPVEEDLPESTPEPEEVPEAQDSNHSEDELPEEESKPTTEQLLKALDFVEDVFNRAAANFVVLGETAKGLYLDNDPFAYSTTINIGVRKGIYQGFSKTTIETFMPQPLEVSDDHMIYEIEGCDVVLELVDDLPWFKDVDSKAYMGRIYAIPNPFTTLPAPKGYYESTFGAYPERN